MIELKNVTKKYKSKQGSDTIALNEINLTLGEKGMIFITGKSGCGKSTLLNILGCLDQKTSGEISIFGENIDSFDEKKKDAYRNSCIGFVFQEFYVLDKYNVSENIELALELKGEPKEDKVEKILEKFDLKQIEKRKINELSGGQKQRVAIARALIKNPSIILADEPTGNLDTTSGKQIFDYLKEISKEHLVVVVSHDLENANNYADRIITLEDGKVKEDIYKNDFIKQEQEEKQEFKQSMLPWNYIIKTACSNMKSKPLKLLFTIIITMMSLIFMGLTINALYFDSTSLIIDTMKENNNYKYQIRKTKVNINGGISSIHLNENYIREIEDFTGLKTNKIYALYNNEKRLLLELGELYKVDEYYGNISPFVNFVELSDESILMEEEILGRLPKEWNELVIHQYLADYILEYGIIDSTGNKYIPKSLEELVTKNHKIKLGSNEVVIVGIIKDSPSFLEESKKNKRFENDDIRNFVNRYYSTRSNYIYTKGFANSAVLEVNKENIINNLYISNNNETLSQEIKLLNQETLILTELGEEQITSLNKNEVVLSIYALKDIDDKFSSELDIYLRKNPNQTYQENLKNFTYIYIKENNIRDIFSPNIFNSSRGIEDSKRENLLKIAGFTMEEVNYLSIDWMNDYNPVTKEVYSLLVKEDNEDNLRKVFNEYPLIGLANENGTYYTTYMEYEMDISYTNSVYKLTKLYLSIISLVFVLFHFLISSNFIATSISYCKKEIGIFRSLGTTKKDIAKIFGFESFIIALLSFILFLFTWYFIVNWLNTSLFGNKYFIFHGVITNPIVIIAILLYTLIISILITLISINRIEKINPIDTILNK